MNSLSWLLYGIGVVSSADIALHLIVIATVFLSAIAAFGYIIKKDDGYNCDEWVELWKKVLRTSLITLIITLSLTIIVPSKQTMIMIAASEIGEKVIHTQKVGDMVDKVVDPSINLLNKYIETEINRLSEPSKSK